MASILKTSSSESGRCDALGAAGLRSTVAGRAVLDLFEREGQVMLTHAEIEALLQAQRVAVGKVTLYRLLNRFVAARLLRRAVDIDRVARYGKELDAASNLQVHPRFECRHCHRLYQLTELPQGLQEVLKQVLVRWEAQGHQGLEADVAVRGVCARCVPH